MFTKSHQIISIFGTLIRPTFLLLFFLLVACTPAQTPVPTDTPSPLPTTINDSTPLPLPTTINNSTPLPANTPSPTLTEQLQIVYTHGVVIPRFLLVHESELGAPWQYHLNSEAWNWEFARITYENPERNGAQLTEGFEILMGRTVEDILGPLPPSGYEMLQTSTTVSQAGEFQLMGTIKEDLGPSFFAVLTIDDYIITVEITFIESTTLSLQEFFDQEVSSLFDEVFQITLAKLNNVSAQEPTPMPSDEQRLADMIGIWLVTENEINEFQIKNFGLDTQGVENFWLSMGDTLIPDQGTACRDFIQVFSDDLLMTSLVWFSNCVVYVGPDFTIGDVGSIFSEPHTSLQSNLNYPAEFALYGFFDENTGHRIFKGFLLNNGFLLRITLEVRTPLGFNLETNEYEEFIYFVLNTTLEKQEQNPLN